MQLFWVAARDAVKSFGVSRSGNQRVILIHEKYWWTNRI